MSSHIEVKKITQIVTGIGALSQREAGARLVACGRVKKTPENVTGIPVRSQYEAGASTAGA